MRAERVFHTRRLSINAIAIVRAAVRGRRFHARQCFANAARVAMATDLLYTEGSIDVVIFKDGPVRRFAHAWLSLRGSVIDPTFRLLSHERLATADLPIWRDRVAGVIPSTRVYRGATFSARQLAKRTLGSGWFGAPEAPA